MGRMNYADVKKENEKFYIHSIIPPVADGFQYSTVEGKGWKSALWAFLLYYIARQAASKKLKV